MGFRFRKSINMGGGFRITLSKSGIGYSWGTKGFRVTKTARGTIRTTSSIPGSGISYSKETKLNMPNQTDFNNTNNNPIKNVQSNIDSDSNFHLNDSNIHTQKSGCFKFLIGGLLISLSIVIILLVCINQHSKRITETNNKYNIVKSYFDYMIKFEPTDIQKKYQLYSIMSDLKGEDFLKRENILFDTTSSVSILHKNTPKVDLSEQNREFTSNYNKLSQTGIRLCNLNSSEKESCDVDYLKKSIETLSANCYSLDSAFLIDNIKLSVLAKNESWHELTTLTEFWLNKQRRLTDSSLFYYFYALFKINQLDRAYQLLYSKMSSYDSNKQNSIWFQHENMIEIITILIRHHQESQVDNSETCSNLTNLIRLVKNYYNIQQIVPDIYCECLFTLSKSYIDYEKINQAKDTLDEAKTLKCNSKKYSTLSHELTKSQKRITQRLAQQKRDQIKAEKRAREEKAKKTKKCEKRKRQMSGRCCCLDGTLGSCGRGGCSHHGGITGWHFCLEGYCD
ncbi:MAG: DUF4236 domain-containing protein [Proteobacteria bacterium]|nr:DUF4236 domain-containing protein [Pseudomonadota bacterium]